MAVFTDEGRGTMTSNTWEDYTGIAWNNAILSGVIWSDFLTIRNTVLTDEPRP